GSNVATNASTMSFLTGSSITTQRCTTVAKTVPETFRPWQLHGPTEAVILNRASPSIFRHLATAVHSTSFVSTTKSSPPVGTSAALTRYVKSPGFLSTVITTSHLERAANRTEPFSSATRPTVASSSTDARM